MVQSDLDLRGFVDLNLDLLKFFGNFYPERKTVVYYIRTSILLGFFLGGTIISELVNLYQSRGDLEQLATASFLTLSNIVSLNKFYGLFKYQRRIFALTEGLNSAYFKPKTKLHREFLREHIALTKTVSYVTFIACAFTCAFWTIYPFTVKSEKKLLPIAAWIPFDVSRSPNYEIAFVYVITGTFIGGLTDLSPDCLISGFLIFISAQLHILNDNLRDISKEEGKLRGCIVHHRGIMEFANEFLSIFSGSIIGQFVTSVLIICFTLFELSLVPFGLKFLSLLLYQFCMLTEIFMFCYFGHGVILESNRLTDSAYSCSWTDSTREFKQDLMFFMMRTQNNLELRAGRYFKLSLVTFVMIIKSSWSYFAVLIQVNQKET